jgi:copper homeostasis protein CutC
VYESGACLQTTHTAIIILVGSGVRIGNIEHLMNETNAHEYHSSASERRTLHTVGNSTSTIRMGAQDTDESRQVTVTHIVADLANAIHSHAADTAPAAVVI